MMTVGIFINYMSCIEESCYCEKPKDIIETLLSDEVSEIETACKAFESTYGRRWKDEIITPTLLMGSDLDTLRAGRAAQQILYWFAIEQLKKKYRISYLSGYSMGYTVAFMAANSLDVQSLLDEVLPANRAYALDNLTAWMEGSIASIFFYFPLSTEFNAAVKDLMLREFTGVKIKDDRPPYSLQVAGPIAQIQGLRDRVFTLFPQAATYSTQMTKSDSAHLTPEKYTTLLERFCRLPLNVPECDIITHVDGTLQAGRPHANLGAVLFNALQAPMRMESINMEARQRGCELVLVGSKRVNRFAFHGFGRNRFSSRYFFWEDLLLHGPIFSDFSRAPVSW